MSDHADTFGQTTRRAVLGADHVARAAAAKTAFDAPFQQMITDLAWGRLWSDETIPRRERSMLTLAILAATGSEEEIAMHVRATARTGASRSDVAQAFRHVTVYAGVSRANRAFTIAKAASAEMGGE
ncbi:MAG: carboxymuconolactone decarboxylase family protein [Pseudomonadota bacterium]